MKILLKRRAKVWIDAGEIVNVSPADANFLLSVDSAELVAEPQVETPESKTKKVTRSKKG